MKILGLGDNVFDVYQNLSISYPGGNAINVAVNASKLGAKASYLGNLADDRLGYYMQSVLKSENVDIDCCNVIKDSSTKQCIENIIDGERQFIRNDLGNHYAGEYEIKDEDIAYMNNFDAILTSCNAKIPNQIKKLKNISGIISYDFGEKEKYRQEDYLNQIIPYIDMAQFSLNSMTKNQIKSFLNQYQFEIPVLITRGQKNPLFYIHQQLIEGTIHSVKAIDTMGAGDAYITALIVALIDLGWGKNKAIELSWIYEAMDKAAAFSSEICQISGAIGHPLKNKNLQGIIFDMDGVLVDSERHFLNLFEKIISDYGKKLDESDKQRFYGCSADMEIQILSQYIPKEYEEVKSILGEFARQNPIDYNKFLMPNIRALLQYLKEKEIKIILASSSPYNDIYKMIKECQLDYFDEIISGEMFKESKPNPEIYYDAIKKSGVSKENLYAIEDSTYGIQAAYNAGLEVIAFRSCPYPVDYSLAYLTFSTHEEILNYLKKVVFKEE